MSKKTASSQNTEHSSRSRIPDVKIIDLNKEDIDALSEETLTDREPYEDEDDGGSEQAPGKKGFRISFHLVFLAIVLTIIAVVAYRIKHWGNFLSQEDIFADGEGNYDDTFDQILPLLDADGNLVSAYADGELTILVLGNAPFADDRDSGNSLKNMVAERTGATIYNCAIAESYVAPESTGIYPDKDPMDIFTPYWMCLMAVNEDFRNNYMGILDEVGSQVQFPDDALDAVETLSRLDLTTIDVLVFFYDGTDYLMGHPMYSDTNTTDILQFTGNIEATVELIQNNCPTTRIIVMSPTYAFGVDDNGEYISSDIKTYGQHFLSTYVNMLYASCSRTGVTYVDNLYGTITEDNAPQYLSDNLHLNLDGRKLVADRLAWAITYYD